MSIRFEPRLACDGGSSVNETSFLHEFAHFCVDLVFIRVYRPSRTLDDHVCIRVRGLRMIVADFIFICHQLKQFAVKDPPKYEYDGPAKREVENVW